MADLYDIIEELTLPIYGGNYSREINPYSVTFENGTPIIAITVPVYLYYGNEDDFDPSRADGDLIPNSLRRALSLTSDSSVHIMLSENENVGNSYHGLYTFITLDSENEISWVGDNLASAVDWSADGIKIFCIRSNSGQYAFLRYQVNPPGSYFPFSSQIIITENRMLTAANYVGDVQFPDTPGGTPDTGGGSEGGGSDDDNPGGSGGQPMSKITLYKNNSEPIVVGKSLTKIAAISGNLRDSTDIVNPEITIKYSKVPDFNYLYYDELKRYYFVDSIESIVTNVWKLGLHVDVLETYKQDIWNCRGLVERNEFTYNPLLVDTAQVYESGYNIEVIDGNINIGGNITGIETPCYMIVGTQLSNGRALV